MLRKDLQPLKPTHTVDFFDGSAMRNATAKCTVERIVFSNAPGGEDMAYCLIQQPVRKTVKVPLTCLVDLATGQRLPYDASSMDDSEERLPPGGA